METVRIVVLAAGGLVALALAVGPRLAARRYASAFAAGHDRAAALWGFLACGPGHRAARVVSRPDA